MQGTSKNLWGGQFSYEAHSNIIVAIDQINPDGFMFIIFLHICVPYADDKAKLWVTVESQLKRGQTYFEVEFLNFPNSKK